MSKIYCTTNCIIVSTLLLCGALLSVKIQKERVEGVPLGSRVGSKFSKSFCSFFNFQQQHKTKQKDLRVPIQYILSVWKNQMSNNVNSDFNLIDFRTSRVPNLLN
jgi:Na+/H+ antiporter NhaB